MGLDFIYCYQLGFYLLLPVRIWRRFARKKACIYFYLRFNGICQLFLLSIHHADVSNFGWSRHEEVLHVRQGQSAEAVASFDVGHARVSCVTTSDIYDLKKRVNEVNQSDGCYEIVASWCDLGLGRRFIKKKYRIGGWIFWSRRSFYPFY